MRRTVRFSALYQRLQHESQVSDVRAEQTVYEFGDLKVPSEI